MIRQSIYIPDEQIEKKALAMLRSFEAFYGQEVTPPVPVDKIIEQHLDIVLDWDVIEETEDEKILGLLDFEKKIIRMNETHRNHFKYYIGTEAYTMGHEIGHWDLHVVKEGEPIQLALMTFSEALPYLCRQAKSDRREIQAEIYASFLLMPNHLLVKAIEDVDLTIWPSLYQLRDDFGVSITALTKRLMGLGLIYIRKDKKIFTSEGEMLGAKSFL